MNSKLKQKKVVTIHLTRIDLENIRAGESVKAPVKTTFETEVPYEVVVLLDGKKDEDYRQGCS